MTKINKKKEFDVSSVTPAMRSAFDLGVSALGSRVRTYDGNSMIYYFANVYKSAEIPTLSLSDGSRYLDIIDEDEPEFVKATRVDDAVLLQTCATVMSGAIDANASYSIPVVSVKAALNADYDSNSGFSLNLIKTTFRSPIWVAYTGDRSATQSPFHAAMTILHWYEKHRDQIGATDNQLLVAFSGVGVTQVTGFKRKTKVSGSGSYSLGVPLIGGSNGNVAAGAEWLTSLQAQRYMVAVIVDGTGKLQITPQRLPSVTEAIDKAVATASVTVDRQASGSDFTLYDRSPRTIIYTIDRLPSAMCTAAWRVVQNGPASPVGSTKIGRPAPIPAEGWNSCRIPVVFTPSKTMSLASSQSLDVTFEYPIGEGAAAQSVRLPAETVTLSALNFPHLLLRKAQARPAVGGKQTSGGIVTTTLQWTFTYQLTDKGQIASADKIDITGLSTSCTQPISNAQWIEPTRRVQLSTDAAGKSLDVILELQWDGDYAGLAAPPVFSTCRLSGDVLFTLPGGQNVPREFPVVQFEYPVAKQPGS